MAIPRPTQDDLLDVSRRRCGAPGRRRRDSTVRVRQRTSKKRRASRRLVFAELAASSEHFPCSTHPFVARLRQRGSVTEPSLAREPRALAILASVGEVDGLGTRKGGLDAFLDQKLAEGYVLETRTDTHAIIARRPRGLKRFTSGRDPGRYVVEVNEEGIATMRPAEPRRA